MIYPELDSFWRDWKAHPMSIGNSILVLHDKLFRLMRHWLWQRLQPLLSSSSVSAGFSVPWPPTRCVSEIIIFPFLYSSRWRFRASLPWVVWWRSFQENLRMQANLAQSCEFLLLFWFATKLWNVSSNLQILRSWVSPNHRTVGWHHNYEMFAGKTLANVRQGTSATCRWFDKRFHWKFLFIFFRL